MTSEEFYVVTFDDGSFYDKLPPQEIKVRLLTIDLKVC